MALSKYIVFEGTDGSGKTTLANMVHSALPNPKVFTKEPGSPHIPLCVDIREEILHNASHKKDALTYAYLFAADTRIHMEKLVKPCLEEGQWVVSDRSVLSDYAYRPYDGDNVREDNFHNFMRQFPMVFFIDTSPEICAQRMEDRSDPNDFEREHVLGKIGDIRNHYLIKAYKKFHNYLKDYTYCEGVWYNIDNNGDVNKAFMQIMGLIVGHFPQLHNLLKIP